MLLIKMSNNAGIYVTLDEGYGVSNRGQRNNPADHMQEGFKKPIRENWMGAPTRSNFTGCGSAGYNQGKAPCASCASGHDGKRICNACRNNANSSAICGGNACAWQPPIASAAAPQYQDQTQTFNPLIVQRPSHQPIFYF